MHTIEQKVELILASVRRVTEDDARAIAQLCLEAEHRGENAGIWHHTSRHFGYPERCHCVPCVRARAGR